MPYFPATRSLRRGAAAAAVTVAAVALAACSSSSSTSSTTPTTSASAAASSSAASKPMNIAYLSFAVQNSYDAPMLAAAQATAAAYGAKLTVFDANNNPQTQQQQFFLLLGRRQRQAGEHRLPVFRCREQL